MDKPPKKGAIDAELMRQIYDSLLKQAGRQGISEEQLRAALEPLMPGAGELKPEDLGELNLKDLLALLEELGLEPAEALVPEPPGFEMVEAGSDADRYEPVRGRVVADLRSPRRSPGKELAERLEGALEMLDGTTGRLDLEAIRARLAERSKRAKPGDPGAEG